MAFRLNGRGWVVPVALLLLLAAGVATAGEQASSRRYPAIVIYVGAG